MLTKTQFEYLFDKHVHAVTSLLSYYTSDKIQLEDWVQEVFIKVWAKREKIDPEHPHVKGYLLQIARNYALYQLRRNKNKPFKNNAEVEDIAVPVHIVNGSLARKELSTAYRKALEQVPPRAKEAFTLSRDKGLSYSQIAREMGISPKTVESQISHTLKILRIELDEFRR